MTEHEDGHKAEHHDTVEHGPTAEHRTVEHVDHYHDTTHDIVHERDGALSWGWRLFLAVGGVLLLAAALAAFQMQDRFDGNLRTALPWLIFFAVILGVAAVVESITTEVWVTLIAGFFLIVIAYVVTGRVQMQLDQQQHAAYIVDRFTGQVRICNTAGCREFGGFGAPTVKLPDMGAMRQSMNKPAAPK